jgi:hypothetical protein
MYAEEQRAEDAGDFLSILCATFLSSAFRLGVGYRRVLIILTFERPRMEASTSACRAGKSAAAAVLR